jgi:hypothetical protein
MRFTLSVLAVILLGTASQAQLVLSEAEGQQQAAPPLSSDQVEFFEKKIRPIFVERCYKCHSAESKKAKGGLLLDTREGMLQGGDHGPAIVPGDAEKSRLIEAIRYGNEDLQMPPRKKLTDRQIEEFVSWVNIGAPDPRTGKSLTPNSQPTTRQHWAFQPPNDYSVPQVTPKSWPQSPVDNFVLVKLEEKGLKPSPPADRRTLIRRLYFDVLGLPPLPREVAEFVADDAPDAYERLVDRLLGVHFLNQAADPAIGEVQQRRVEHDALRPTGRTVRMSGVTAPGAGCNSPAASNVRS